MPRIDPQQLLKTLGVLLGPHGGIKSSDEVVRLAQLMQKFSKKLVSKCIYINIMKATPNDILDKFLSERGWELLNQWFADAVSAHNWSLCCAIIQLFNVCPVTAARLKDNADVNNAPKLINQLKQDPNIDENVRSLAAEVSMKWMRAKWVRHVSPSKCTKLVNGNDSMSDTHIKLSPQFNGGKRKAAELEEGSGILVLHRDKNKIRKTIKWKPDTCLVSIKYFELDEDERVNVNKQKFENMRKFEITMEKAALSSKTEIVIDDQEFEKWYKPVPLTYDENSHLKPSFTNHGSESQEKLIQHEREKNVLQALYFNLESTPNTPQEPDISSDSICEVSDVITKIPLLDKDAEEHNYTLKGWPAAKTNKVDNEYAASISSAFQLPPALSNLLASIETKGLESIIPSPGTHKQDNQSCQFAPSNNNQKFGTINDVNKNSTLIQTSSVPQPILPSVNTNTHVLSAGNFLPKSNPLGLDTIPGQEISGFSLGHYSPTNITKSPSPRMISPNQIQIKEADNLNILRPPFNLDSSRGRISNHHGSNYDGKNNNYHEFRRAFNGSDDYSEARMRDHRHSDTRELNFHNDRESFKDNFNANRRSDDPTNYTRGKSNKICFQFRDQGRCSKGDRCFYVHRR